VDAVIVSVYRKLGHFMGHGDKRLYNYVVNTLGISTKMVLEYVDKRLEELIGKKLEGKLNSKYVEGLILSRVTSIMTDGLKNNNIFNYRRDDFEEYLKKILRSVVEERVRNEFEVQVKVVPKDASIVGKPRP